MGGALPVVLHTLLTSLRAASRAARRISLRTPCALPARRLGHLPARARRISLRAARRNPFISQRLAATGFTVEATGAATLTRTITADLARWRAGAT